MRYQRIGLTAFVTFLATILSVDLGLPVLNRYFSHNSQVLAQSSEARKAEANRLFDQGIQQFQTSQVEAALQSWQQALIIYREIKNRLGEGTSLGNLGIAYHSLGDYAKAIEYHQQYLAISGEIKDRLGEGQSLGNLGLAYHSLGDYAKAIDYHQQSLAIAREIKDRQVEGASLGNLGSAYDALGDYAKAIEYHQQRLAIAREIKDRLGEGQSLGNLGIAYKSLGDYAKAIEYYQQSLAIAKGIGDRIGEGNNLNNLGNTLFKTGNLTQAEKILRTGIETYESHRARLGDKDAYKISIFEGQATTYRLLQQVLIKQNQPNAALEIAERGRARAFVELLATRLSPIETQSPKVAPPTIEQIKQIAKVQNSTLVQYSIIYDDFNVQGKKQAKQSKLYIWVIKPTGEVNFRNVDLIPLWQKQDTSLSDLVTNARESIGVRGLAVLSVVPHPEAVKNAEEQATKRLQQLHQLLIEPIANLLPTDPNAHVTFIPQESLFLAPFPALQDASGKYLIEKHTIRTAPSIQVLDLTHTQRQRVGAHRGTPLQGNDALVVGNPTMPSIVTTVGEKPQQLPPLPGAEREAKAIAPLLNTQPLIGSQATKKVVTELLPKARIIHLATHGLLDNVDGIGSAIALAPNSISSLTPPLIRGAGGVSPQSAQGVNGLLTAAEILSLKLNAELVVLSACDTGSGKLVGDGVVGLSRSLISAGTSSVMVSLWAVSDDSTAVLMTEFYKNIQHNPDKAQALRQAMLTTMRQIEYSNPLQWAAFTLIGEAQ